MIAGTTGISRPLGDPEKVARWLAAGDWTRLVRRLESDVKALHAFYRYGVLHGYVRLRRGFLDEVLSADWAQRGEPNLHEILRRAQKAGGPLDVVVGSAPGWSNPWSRGRRVEVISLEPWTVVLREGGVDWPVDLRNIPAVRPAGA